MRPLPEGTVPRGALRDDEHLHAGRIGEDWALELPPSLPLSEELLARGRDQYEVHCAPCHDSAGTGQGTVVQRGFLPPPSFHDDRLRAMPLGQLYDVIANGVRNMPAYRGQVAVEDRWAIATHVRVLQVSRSRSLADVPAEVRRSEDWGTP